MFAELHFYVRQAEDGFVVYGKYNETPEKQLMFSETHDEAQVELAIILIGLGVSMVSPEKQAMVMRFLDSNVSEYRAS